MTLRKWAREVVCFLICRLDLSAGAKDISGSGGCRPDLCLCTEMLPTHQCSAVPSIFSENLHDFTYITICVLGCDSMVHAFYEKCGEQSDVSRKYRWHFPVILKRLFGCKVTPARNPVQPPDLTPGQSLIIFRDQAHAKTSVICSPGARFANSLAANRAQYLGSYRFERGSSTA